MARIFRKTWTKKHPDGRREKRTYPRWYIEYTDASGRTRRSVGYCDKAATRQKAADLVKQVERERAGIIDRKSIDISAQLGATIAKHVDAYRLYLSDRGVSAWHLSETMRRLNAVLTGCGFASLRNIQAEPLQRWCSLRRDEGTSPRTINTYTGSLRAFVRWAITDGRMLEDRLATIRKADENADVRRERRALTENELIRLLDVAEHRPLIDALTIRRGRRKGALAAKVSTKERERLERLGH